MNEKINLSIYIILDFNYFFISGNEVMELVDVQTEETELTDIKLL